MTSPNLRAGDMYPSPSPTIYGLPQDEQFLRRLWHAEKMRTIGLLAGGVAHDFNNVLSMVINYARFVEEALPPGDSAREDVREIIKAGNRGTTLIRQLLAFAREDKAIWDPVDVNAALADMENFIRRAIGNNIHLAMRTSPQKAMVKIDPGHIQQIVMNLAINARDAMPEGGQLLIRSKPLSLTQDHVRRGICPAPGPYVCVSVADSGQGIPDSVRDRIFEPFFTTKDPTRGTGLGLWTVRGILKDAGGGTFIRSEEGTGTTIDVYLPRVYSGSISSGNGSSGNGHL